MALLSACGTQPDSANIEHGSHSASDALSGCYSIQPYYPTLGVRQSNVAQRMLRFALRTKWNLPQRRSQRSLSLTRARLLGTVLLFTIKAIPFSTMAMCSRLCGGLRTIHQTQVRLTVFGAILKSWMKTAMSWQTFLREE